MYTYVYVSVQAGTIFVRGKHREIIDEYSKKGWRFVAAIPNACGSNGQITSHDLVFEKYDPIQVES
ncbi:MAG: DUF4177 domain-containing protein [Culicoidibacterales bacterium]